MDKKSIIKKIIKYVLIIMLFVFSFWYLFKDIELHELKNGFKNIKASFLILAILMVYAQIFIQGLCYVVMGKGLGVKLNPFRCFGYCSIDLFFSQITPFAVGGQPVMVYKMKKDDLDVSTTTPMVLLYSFMNKFALIILAILAASLYFNDFFKGDNNKIMIFLIIFGVVSNIIIASMSIMFMFMGGFVYKVGVRIIFFLANKNLLKKPYTKAKKLKESINNFKMSSSYFKSHLLLCLIVLILCILKRMATFAIGYFIYKGFSFSEHGFFYIIFAQTVYALISDSFPIPGGIGAAEVSIKSLYDGIYTGSALGDVAALLVRGISYYGLILVSGITTLFVMSTGKKKKEDETNEGNSEKDSQFHNSSL